MSFMIPAGPVQLEANLREPAGSPRGTAVVCHPHPVYGGTMDNRVVFRAAKAAAEAGFAALRFNFRGAGQSTGLFDQGVGEKEDVAAMIQWLTEKYPGIPMALIGYSFGAWVGLQVACSSPGIVAMVGLGIPLDLYSMEFLIENPKPALYIVGTKDEFCSQESLDGFARRLPASSFVHQIDEADHFFSNHADIVQGLIYDFFFQLQLDQNTL
ncbi:MAG TPA: alpha/beta fold hydrolase [Acidobacteriota bacterium]|nr:alpha/beta fold hydrolase [Acidobacteriota bacterium]